MGGTDTTGATDGAGWFGGSWAACPGEPRASREGTITSNKAPLVIKVRKSILRIVSSIQFADGPIGVLAHGGIEILGLTKFFQMWLGFTVMPFHQLIDQRHLNQRRLLFL